MTVINTNISSIQAQTALRTSRAGTEQAMERLSTGLKINRAGDDAAGLAIASRMTSQIKGLNAAVKNAQDGIALLQTAEGALNEVSNMLQRMRELSLQSLNGTNNTKDRGYLNDEVTELTAEISRVGLTTRFNDTVLFDGAFNQKMQVGAKTGANEEVAVDLTTVKITTTDLLTAAPDITDAAKAATSVANIDTALDKIDAARSKLGALQNRLEHTVSNLTNIATNTELARSRIQDADYARETSNMTRGQIVQQAGTAMLAQANKMSQSVLSLLQ